MIVATFLATSAGLRPPLGRLGGSVNDIAASSQGRNVLYGLEVVSAPAVIATIHLRRLIAGTLSHHVTNGSIIMDLRIDRLRSNRISRIESGVKIRIRIKYRIESFQLQRIKIREMCRTTLFFITILKHIKLPAYVHS